MQWVFKVETNNPAERFDVSAPQQCKKETHPGVQVTKGIFDVMPGSVMKLDIPFDARYYLGISVRPPDETRI